MYQIRRIEYAYNSDNEADIIKDEMLPMEYADPTKANQRIMRYADAWRNSVLDNVKLVQHHAGESVVYFKWGYIEYSRTGDQVYF